MFQPNPHWSINSQSIETKTMKLYALLAVAVALPIPQKKVTTPKLTTCRKSLLECADSNNTELCISNYKKCKRLFGPGGYTNYIKCANDRIKCDDAVKKSIECREAKIEGEFGEEQSVNEQFRQCRESLSSCSKKENDCLRASE